MAATDATNDTSRTTPRLFSYVVHHDEGHAPNPYSGICTLCRCKYRQRPEKPKNIVEIARPGDWVVGTGGASKKSAGHGKIIYAMRVDAKISRLEYYRAPSFARKKRRKQAKTYAKQVGDNLRPITLFEKNCQSVLVSRYFWYFGRSAIPIPKAKFPHLEKKGPGFRCDFKGTYISRFTSWLKNECKPPGKRDDPCWRRHEDSSQQKGKQVCKSSC